MAGRAVPRAGRISLEKDREEKRLRLSYFNKMRAYTFYASLYSVKLKSVDLDTSTYEEANCPMGMKTCYNWQRINNYWDALFGIFFYSIYKFEDHVSKNMVRLYIETKLVYEDTSARAYRLGFRKQEGRHNVEFISAKHFHLLV